MVVESNRGWDMAESARNSFETPRGRRLVRAMAYHVFRMRRGWALSGIVLLITPLIVGATRATYGYLSGTARLPLSNTVGVLPAERSNLDERYRLFARIHLESVSVPHAVLAWIENAVLVQLLERFGPMRGSYTGPYPSRDAVYVALIQSRQHVTPDELFRPFRVAGRMVQVSPTIARQALGDYEPKYGGGKITLVSVGNGAVALGYWLSQRYHAELVDERFGWFAHYLYTAEGARAVPLPERE